MPQYNAQPLLYCLQRSVMAFQPAFFVYVLHGQHCKWTPRTALIHCTHARSTIAPPVSHLLCRCSARVSRRASCCWPCWPCLLRIDQGICDWPFVSLLVCVCVCCTRVVLLSPFCCLFVALFVLLFVALFLAYALLCHPLVLALFLACCCALLCKIARALRDHCASLGLFLQFLPHLFLVAASS